MGSDNMKIEKLSDNQIRCTLNKSDLASRQLKISELAYGSEKAKELFRDMMQQASYELGFEADDIPLMIEAIPVSADCIVLIVTKVDDPEELDTRFSKFSAAGNDDEDLDYDYPFEEEFDTLSTIEDPAEPPSAPLTASDELELPSDEVATDVINLFSKVKDYLNKNISESATENSMSKIDTENTANHSTDFVPLHETLAGKKAAGSAQVPVTPVNTPVVRIFSFDSLETFNDAAAAVCAVYCDRNSLYKDVRHSIYYLALEKTDCSPVNFNKACNILSEYGSKEPLGANSIHFFREHFDCIVRDRAIQVFSKI